MLCVCVLGVGWGLYMGREEEEGHDYTGIKINGAIGLHFHFRQMLSLEKTHILGNTINKMLVTLIMN